MPRANGITRQEILTSIKCHGSMTAEELARELNISQVAVRQHLGSLEAENIITISVERRGLGRPSHRYTLTPTGDEMFPRRYEALTNALLDELRSWQGDEAVIELFRRQREKTLLALRSRICDKPLPAQVGELARIQTENGYMAEVSEEESGMFRLVQHNCPFCTVARNHPDTCCDSEMALFHALLPDAEIARERYLLDGHHNCVFRILRQTQRTHA